MDRSKIYVAQGCRQREILALQKSAKKVNKEFHVSLFAQGRRQSTFTRTGQTFAYLDPVVQPTVRCCSSSEDFEADTAIGDAMIRIQRLDVS